MSDDNNINDINEQPTSVIPSNGKKKKVSKKIRRVRKTALTVSNGASADAGAKEKGKKKKGMRLWVKIVLVLFCLGLVACLTGVGIIASWMSEAPPLNMDSFEFTASTMIYDINGDPYQELQSRERRIPVQIEEIPEMVQLCFLSIEDQRYYSHFGIDIRGTAKAVIGVLSSGSTEGPGGSTITQQLIKLTHLTSDKLLERKAMEWKLSYQLEEKFSKREILEAYLNKVNMSQTWGVQSAAKLYFGKDVKELSLAQSAVLASIINRPNLYNPYLYVEDENGKTIIQRDKDEKGNVVKVGYSAENQDRALQVVAKMLELGHISQREYEIARDELKNNEIGLILPKTNSTYTYFTDAVYSQVLKDLMDQQSMTDDEAANLLNNGGLKIYATVDPIIQKSLETQANNNSNFPSQTTVAKNASKAESKATGETKNYIPQVAGVIIQNKTGYVTGIVGGRGKKTGSLEMNRALEKYQIGSTTKPITVYAPGFNEGTLTLATTFDNVKLNFGGWKPTNYDGSYPGMTSCRDGISHSINIMAVMGYYKVGAETCADYAEEFGFTIERQGSQNDMGPGALALGGYTYGQSPLVLANAYTVFPNGGYRVTPTFYTKVENSKGVVILEARQETIQVISEEAAWITTEALKDCIGQSTKSMKVSGQQIAGKTGTTNNSISVLFAGFTKEYTGAFWFGYDKQVVNAGGKKYTLKINTTSGRSKSPASFWEKVFQDFYKKKNISSAKLPSKPDNVFSAAIDKVSGKAPTELTELDPRGSMVGKEYFIKGTYPTESDDMHVEVQICTETGLLATEFCPSVTKVLVLKDPEKLYPDKVKPVNPDYVSKAEKGALVPKKTCTAHTSVNSFISNFIFVDASGNKVTDISVNVGSSVTLYLKRVDGSGNVSNVTFESPILSSSGPNIASVSGSGKQVVIQGIEQGFGVKITAAYEYSNNPGFVVGGSITVNVLNNETP